MADTETPESGSPLSEIDSVDVPDDYEARMHRSRSASNASTISDAPSDASQTPSTSTPRHSDMPPAKRRRTGAATYDHPTLQALAPPLSPSGSISSDSSGSVPTSPSFAHLGPTHPLSTAYAAAQANPSDPEMADYVQVTKCQWTGCTEREQNNMDNLVDHINNVHIPPRQKKYFCEWEGCTRKSLPHTSAYALKAHMRSHTKEKPFLCALPECDRSFTRSDALAKHMRTVHETEALRPSDPVPRGHTGGISTGAHGSNGTIKRIKLVMGGANGDKRNSIISELPPLPTRQTLAAERKVHPDAILSMELAPLTSAETADPGLKDAVSIDNVKFTTPVPADYYPADVYEAMEDYERDLPPSQYFRLLRRQIHWANQESAQLARELIDARATTDDANGREIQKTTSTSSSKDNGNTGIYVPHIYSSTDERIGDEIRREEWYMVEGLLDKVLAADLENAWKRTSAAADPVLTSNGDNQVAEDVPSGEVTEDQKPVRGHKGTDIKSLLSDNADPQESRGPWTLLKAVDSLIE